MGIVFGMIAALCLGMSDWCATRASRLTSPVSVTRTQMVTSGFVAVVALFALSSTWSVRDTVLGGLSGAIMTTGLVLLYLGYSKAPVAIVAPTSSVLTGAIPVAVAIGQGESPRQWAWAGIALGLCGIAMATYTPGGFSAASAAPSGSDVVDTASPQPTNVMFGLKLGIAAGLCFGGAFALVAATSNGAGATVIVVQRVVGFVGLTGFWWFKREPFFAPSGPGLKLAAIAGVIAGVALLSLKLGYQRGPDGSVSVAASQYATFAVIFAALLLRERPSRLASLGIACAAAGVAFMSI